MVRCGYVWWCPKNGGPHPNTQPNCASPFRKIICLQFLVPNFEKHPYYVNQWKNIYIYRCFSKIGTIKHDISTECSFVHRYCQKGKIQHQSKAPLLPRLFMIFYGWLVVWNMAFIFPFSWECHHPNWRTHIFQRGRSTTNQTVTSTTKSKQRCRAFGIWHLFDGQNVGGTYRKFSKTSGYPRCPQFQYSDPQLLALKLKKDGGEVLLKPPFFICKWWHLGSKFL